MATTPTFGAVKLTSDAKKKKATGDGTEMATTPKKTTGKSGPPGTVLGSPPVTKVVGSGSSGASASPVGSPFVRGPQEADNAAAGQTVNASQYNYAAANGAKPGTSIPNGDPFTGFAGRYAPSGVGNLYQNPQILANDVLSSMGYGGNVALQSQLGDLAEVAPALAFLMNAGRGAGAQGDEDLINTAGSFLRSQGTPGGQGVDYQSLLGSIMGATGDDNLIRGYTTKDANGNPLGGADQSSAIKGLISAALTNMNPFSQRAAMGMVGSGLTDWQGQLAGGMQPGGAGTAIDYLRQNGILKGLY